jgi:hypothetical protein
MMGSSPLALAVRPSAAKESLVETREEMVAETVTVTATGSAKSAAARSSRRFDRTLGFWLGAVALGTVGCILGAHLAYPHWVAVTVSVLWWGIFLGCFGGSIGGLLGLWAEQTSPKQKKNKSRADSTNRGRIGLGLSRARSTYSHGTGSTRKRAEV